MEFLNLFEYVLFFFICVHAQGHHAHKRSVSHLIAGDDNDDRDGEKIAC